MDPLYRAQRKAPVPDDLPANFHTAFNNTLPLCVISFLFGLLPLIFGCLLADGDTHMVINGVPTIVHESEFLGPALIFVSFFFFICLTMFATFLLSITRKYKCNHPWFYCFSAAFIPACLAAYFFIQRIGMERPIRYFFCGLICFACCLLCAAQLIYMYLIVNMKMPAKKSSWNHSMTEYGEIKYLVKI